MSHRLMKKKSAQTLSSTRWLAYAAAASATTLAAAPSAEAHIHYSGPVDRALDSEHSSQREAFALSDGVTLYFHEFSNPDRPTSNFAGVSVVGPVSFGSIRGSSALASRLQLKDRISQGPFTYYSYVGNIQSLFGAGEFKAPGIAFIGFRFDAGSGTQYGWARIKLRGAPSTQFIVLDYAWGDPGDRIKAGQTHGGGSAETADAAKGSLGLLALGRVGLDAMRHARTPLLAEQ